MIVVLGDSISAGVGATHLLARYPARIRASLVIAKPGWTSKRLLKEVKRQPAVIWEEATDLIIFIGGNDLLYAYPYLISKKKKTESVEKVYSLYEKNVVSVCNTIKPYLKKDARLYLVGLYNPIPNSERAVEVIQQFNRVTMRIAKNQGAHFIDLEKPFLGNEPKLIDGFKSGELEDLRFFRNPIHPTDEGHSVIASTIVREMALYQARISGRTLFGNTKPKNVQKTKTAPIPLQSQSKTQVGKQVSKQVSKLVSKQDSIKNRKQVSKQDLNKDRNQEVVRPKRKQIRTQAVATTNSAAKNASVFMKNESRLFVKTK